ncbi:hypothetical protein K7X08_019901 [Anisodus acutangulus]|uniref:chitinase n=1 Tax=Anisodus acutangulus TaxID=402998 RepID=A0A9Q1MW41_9SOLA|nr:hypothetical protein K7X08_019901 [Anisodus acutangulus]
MLKNRDDNRCPASGFYTYDAFIAAANSFPGFGTTGDDTARKKEIAAFFGQTSHETTGNQVGNGFYGRGPIQLTGQSNYDLAGKAIGQDLVNNPDLVATDATVSFKTAIWFWMTPQDNKPSCHDVITGQWTPSAADTSANRQPATVSLPTLLTAELNVVKVRIGKWKIGLILQKMLSFRNNDACPAKGFYTYDAFIAAATSFPGFGTLAQDIGSIVTRDLFEQMLSFRNNDACPAKGFYTYDAFIAAANSFPGFGTTGDDTARKKEIAAFFGQTSHETNGGASGTFNGGYCFVRQIDQSERYYGRGPIQLTHQANYDRAGRGIQQDLVNNPDLVATDALISFKTAIWFWMTPQDNKPSSHDVIIGRWTPSAADMSANRVPGYGVITNIINGGLECGMGRIEAVENRIGFYRRYCSMLNVAPGDNLDCYNQRNFAQG